MCCSPPQRRLLGFIPLLLHPLPCTFSAITDSFPSYYRLLVRRYRMFHHRGIGIYWQTVHHDGTSSITIPPDGSQERSSGRNTARGSNASSHLHPLRPAEATRSGPPAAATRERATPRAICTRCGHHRPFPHSYQLPKVNRLKVATPGIAVRADSLSPATSHGQACGSSLFPRLAPPSPRHFCSPQHLLQFASPDHVVAPTISHIIGSANLGCLPPPPCHLLCPICSPWHRHLFTKCSPTTAPSTSNTPVERGRGSSRLVALPPPSPPHLSPPGYRDRHCQMEHRYGTFCLILPLRPHAFPPPQLLLLHRRAAASQSIGNTVATLFPAAEHSSAYTLRNYGLLP